MKSLFIASLMFSFLYSAEENPSLDYIETYKLLAVQEMHRTGIPASIKMAQALLESGAGKSTLATKANNHFGIKCNGGWEGDTYYHEDDDYKDGKLIASCFRKFTDVYASFYAHSQFLMDQRRYAFLFDISSKDYHAWAKGLRKAGYATDKAYATKLINIIEKYQLYLLDDMDNTPQRGDDLTAVEAPPAVDISNTSSTTAPPSDVSHQSRGEERSKSTKKPLIRVNKKSAYHIVREGETLAAIASAYDLEEIKIRLRNRLPKDAEPLRGEKIYLRKKISLTKRPKFTRIGEEGELAMQEEFIF